MCAQAQAQLGAGDAAVVAARSGLLLALALLASNKGPVTLAQAVRALRRGGVLDVQRGDVCACVQEVAQLLDVMVQAGDRRAQRDARGVGRVLLQRCPPGTSLIASLE